MKKSFLKKSLAAFVGLSMGISMVSVPVFAEDGDITTTKCWKYGKVTYEDGKQVYAVIEGDTLTISDTPVGNVQDMDLASKVVTEWKKDKNIKHVKFNKSSTGATFTSTLDSLFENMSGITDVDMSGVVSVTLKSDFEGCSSLRQVTGITATGVPSLANTFKGCTKLTTIDLSGVAANVASLEGTFSGCHALSEITGLNTLCGSNTTSLKGTFQACSSFTTLDLTNWNTSSVTDAATMFNQCQNLETITIGPGFELNDAVTNLGWFMNNCISLDGTTIQNIIDRIDTSNVTDAQAMLAGTAELKTLNLADKNFAKLKVSPQTSFANVLRASGIEKLILPDADALPDNSELDPDTDIKFPETLKTVVGSAEAIRKIGYNMPDATVVVTTSGTSTFDENGNLVVPPGSSMQTPDGDTIDFPPTGDPVTLTNSTDGYNIPEGSVIKQTNPETGDVTATQVGQGGATMDVNGEVNLPQGSKQKTIEAANYNAEDEIDFNTGAEEKSGVLQVGEAPDPSEKVWTLGTADDKTKGWNYDNAATTKIQPAPGATVKVNSTIGKEGAGTNSAALAASGLKGIMTYTINIDDELLVDGPINVELYVDPMKLKDGDTTLNPRNLYIFHVGDDGLEYVPATYGAGVYKFQADDFSDYIITKDNFADNAYITFKKTANNQVYDIYLMPEKGKNLNRVNNVDLTFDTKFDTNADTKFEDKGVTATVGKGTTAEAVSEKTSDGVSYYITANSEKGIALNTTGREGDENRYDFVFEKNGDAAKSNAADANGFIKLGTVTFQGVGDIVFTVKGDVTYTIPEGGSNVAHTATLFDNITPFYTTKSDKVKSYAKADITEFETGVTYYTKDLEENMVPVPSDATFDAQNEYYTEVNGTTYGKVLNVADLAGGFQDLNTFKAGTVNDYPAADVYTGAIYTKVEDEKRDVIVTIDFNNNITDDTKVEYQNMAVTFTSLGLERPIKAKLGFDALSTTDAKKVYYMAKADKQPADKTKALVVTDKVEDAEGYVAAVEDDPSQDGDQSQPADETGAVKVYEETKFDKEQIIVKLYGIPAAYTGNFVISGDGYRTARYSSTIPVVKGAKEVNFHFWNNAKDTQNATAVNTTLGSDKQTINFLAGDILEDGIINIKDLSAAVSYFGRGEANDTEIKDMRTKASANQTYVQYDLNRDGRIDSRDVAYVLVSWGK